MMQRTALQRPYSDQTLIYNWREERADVKNERSQKPLPSQYDHYYGTTYECAYGTIRGDPPRPEVRNLQIPRHYAFPGHQPEFDFPQMKASVNTYVTEYRAGYCHQCQRPLPSDDPSWNSKTKVCLHCKDRIYTVDPNPDPYTLTVQYPQDPHRKNYTPAHQEIPTETSNNK